MSGGIGRIVVGYRKGSRMIRKLQDEHGLHAVEIRPCIAGCGYPVYFVPSGVDAIRERDAEVICTECKELYYGDIMREL